MAKENWRDLFSGEELSWFLHLGSAMHDPEQKRSFFETVVEKKRADRSYSLFTDFPKEAEVVMTPAQSLADKYAGAIIARLKGIGGTA